MSYVRQSVRGWDWVIGSGVYLDDIDTIIAQYQRNLLDELHPSKIIIYRLHPHCPYGAWFFIVRKLSPQPAGQRAQSLHHASLAEG